MDTLNVRWFVGIRIDAGKDTLNLGGHIKAARNRLIIRRKKIFQMDRRVTLQVYVAFHSQCPAFAVSGASYNAVISRQRPQKGSELGAFDNLKMKFLLGVRRRES